MENEPLVKGGCGSPSNRSGLETLLDEFALHKDPRVPLQP